MHGPWRTRHQLEVAIIEWIDWYNASRLSHGVSPVLHDVA
ncbi:MAG: IS3 family transposase [Chloroflexota bacterium]